MSALSSKEITSAQLTVWIITALAGPLVFFSDGNWVATLIASCVIGSISWISVRYGRHWNGPVYAFVQVLWIALILSQIAAFSADCWPTGKQTFPVIPLTMLVLAVLSAIKGDRNTANGISVLFWVVCVLLGIVILFGIGDIRLNNLKPKVQTPESIMLLVLILPAVAGFLNKERCSAIPFIAVATMAVGISLWIAGTLSPQIAEKLLWPFYDAAKSVQLLDIAKRFEALVSVGVTVGNYALYSMLFCAVETIYKPYGHERGMVVATGVLAAALMLLEFSINPVISLIISGILWLFFPLLGLLKPKKKE